MRKSMVDLVIPIFAGTVGLVMIPVIAANTGVSWDGVARSHLTWALWPPMVLCLICWVLGLARLVPVIVRVGLRRSPRAGRVARAVAVLIGVGFVALFLVADSLSRHGGAVGGVAHWAAQPSAVVACWYLVVPLVIYRRA